MIHMIDLTMRMSATAFTVTCPASRSAITSYPTPSALGSINPPTPTAKPPSAGHHIQWIGKRAEEILSLVEQSRQHP